MKNPKANDKPEVLSDILYTNVWESVWDLMINIMIKPVVIPSSISTRFISSLSVHQPNPRLNNQVLRSPDANARRDIPFNGYRIPYTCQARELVDDVLSAIQSHESRLGIRQRARKSVDQQTFERQVKALVCDLAYREMAAPGAWVSIPFSKVVLGRRDRYRSKVVNESIPSVVRMMAASGLELLEFQVGYHNPFDFTAGRQTVIRASQTLHNLIAERRLTKTDFGLEKAEEVIILKASKEAHWDKGEWIQYDDTLQTMEYRADLKRINDWLEQADLEYVPYALDRKQVDLSDRRLRRYFNNSSFEQGGRLFGGFWQGMKKEERAYGIVIDGSPVVTLDYGQMAPRMLYGLVGADPHFTDAYAVPGLEGYRDGTKLVFNAMLHAERLLARKPEGSAHLLPKALSIADITALIIKFHEPVQHAFYAGKGMYLSYQESRILIAVLKRLHEQGIVGLPIHDAVIVAEHHKDQTKQVMLEVFKELTGIEGMVEYDT